MNNYNGMSPKKLKKELVDVDLLPSDRELLELTKSFLAAVDSGDEDQILPVAERLAERGSADAAEIAGEIHFKRKKFKVAEVLFKQAAARGNTRAMLFLAELLNYGQIPSKDPQKEYFSLVKKASGLGDPQATYKYACCFRDEIGTDFDFEMFFSLLKDAAKGGCTDARKELAQLYITGKGLVKLDLEKARALLSDLVEQGDGEAILILGCSYIDSDPKQAKELFRQAAAKGLPDAKTVIQMMDR